MKTLTNSQNGFTLIETLIAMVVFSVGILGLASMQITSIQGNSQARQITEASNLAADRIESILSLDYYDTALKDVDGDGTGQDTSTPHDGLDNSGGNFGLDDATDATADGAADSDGDGVNDIFWNIAIDTPLLHTKTIKFIIDPPGSVKNIEITYMKADII